MTALHVAVIKNYIDIVKILIKAGSNVNHKTYDSMTPLHFATSRGFLDLVSSQKILKNNRKIITSTILKKYF